MAIAAFAFLLTVPVWGQRGGGGRGGGGGMHGGGFSGRGGGFVGRSGGFVGHGGGYMGGARPIGGRSFAGVHSGGVRSYPGFSRGYNRSFNRGFTRSSSRSNGSHNGRSSSSNSSRRHHRNRHSDWDDFTLRNYCYGYNCSNNGYGSWGWGWGWGYDPSWWWGTWEDQDRRFDEDYYRQLEIANEWNRQNLEEQQMRRRQEEQEEADGDQDAYAPRSSERSYAPATQPQPEAVAPATVLVFRDQRKEEVSNYAIVGQTLWSYSGQRTKKVPLADLDMAATEKANDDRGVAFRIPLANQGQ